MVSTGDRDAVLVVDDEPASVELLRISLSEEFEVYTATAGDAALDVLAAHPEIAVAVIDQRMPGMTGTGADPAHRMSPIPIWCASSSPATATSIRLIDAINAGRVYRYLTKPWDVDELLATVRQGARDAPPRRWRTCVCRRSSSRPTRDFVRRTPTFSREAKGRHRFDEIVGSSAALRELSTSSSASLGQRHARC